MDSNFALSCHWLTLLTRLSTTLKTRFSSTFGGADFLNKPFLAALAYLLSVSSIPGLLGHPGLVIVYSP